MDERRYVMVEELEALQIELEIRDKTIRDLSGQLAAKDKELSHLRVLKRMMEKALRDGSVSPHSSL